MALETAVSLKDVEALDRTRFSPSGRRREARYPTNDPAKIRILSWDDPERLAGTVLDVSRSGMRVEVAKPLPTGTRGEVILDRASNYGEIRYCRRVALVYHVGIAIEDVFYPPPCSSDHIHDDQLSLYVAGEGIESPGSHSCQESPSVVQRLPNAAGRSGDGGAGAKEVLFAGKPSRKARVSSNEPTQTPPARSPLGLDVQVVDFLFGLCNRGCAGILHPR